MSDSAGTERLDPTIPLLEAASVKDLLEWAPSHQRRFSEAAADTMVVGWNNVFTKFESLDAISQLLRMERGFDASEEICRKAAIRGVAEAVARRARAALRLAHGSPKASWPARLHEVGRDREAAWVLWLQERGGRPNPDWERLVGESRQIADLLAARPFAVPFDGAVDPFERILEGLTATIDRLAANDQTLPFLLREAADALDAAARDAIAKAALEADRTVALLDDLQASRQRIGESGGSFDIDAVAALDRFLGTEPRPSTERLAATIASAGAYADAARAWRTIFDALQDTHDYEGVGRAYSFQEAAWRILADTSADPGEASDGIGDPSAPEQSVSRDDGDGEDSRSTAPEPTVAPYDIGPPPPDERDPIEVTGEDAFVTFEPGTGPEPARDEVSIRLAEDACATSLTNGRYGLAASVAAVAASEGLASPFGFSRTLLDMVVCGLATGEPRCERAVERFDAQRDILVEELADDAGRPVQLMAFAAALRPALFAIEAGAEAVLRHITSPRSFGEGVSALARFATETARSGQIATTELADVRDRLAPERALEALRAETERFLDQAQRKTIKFQRATVIWTSVLRTGQVHDALRGIIDGSANAAVKVSTAINGDLADIDRLIATADRDIINGRKAQPLTAGARGTLKDWIEDVAGRLRAWQQLTDVAVTPDASRYGLQNRQELRRMLDDAEHDLRELALHHDDVGASTESRALRFAAMAAYDAVTSVLRLFEPQEPSRLSLEMRLGDDLLLLQHTWKPDASGSWSSAERRSFLVDVDALSNAPPDFVAAFERALAGGHFPQAAQARDRLAVDEPDSRERVDARLKGERDVRTASAFRALGRVGKRLNDLLGADDRQILSRDLEPELDKLREVLQEGEPQIDHSEWDARLAEIDATLDHAFNSLLGPLRDRMNRLEGAGHDVADLRKMEEMKDLTTLAEHIEAYEKGATPPDPPAGLMEAFSRQMLANHERRFDLPSLQRANGQRERLGSVDFGGFEDGQLEASANLLQAWRELRANDGRDSGAQVKRLFQALLTSQVDVTQYKASGVPGHYLLKTPTYADREECVAPAFGSAAQGRYDVILVESHNIGSGVEPAALKSRVGAPTFFVVRGQMPAAARRAFMVQVRGKGANPACGLIDEALVLFLATRATRRRSDLFGLALAMGVVQPYSDTAQQTSPEMFFGRAEELREIWDPNGSCLVYGGRQLGKTALLRQIELRHGGQGQIVVYGDQMVEGFGDGRPGSFWTWIGKALQGRGVPVPPRASSEAIREAIRSWLRADGTRRILFLIDEADAFLRIDIRSEFKVLVEVRELMRVTERRCKFVFAGLHDVQRLARTPNSPLLHFGNPIRVGPLMGKDLFEARSMVEQPMAAAGYAFGATSEEGRALVGRALSEVGYYPSLMQTFGMVLVNRLNGRASSRIESPPVLPIRISEAELNEALDDNTFRDSVRMKFDNTLNLDQRYRLIAYLVLLGTQESASREDMRPGMSIAEIQRDAMYWWPQGFADDSSNSAFEGLLKEMEGLGALVGLSDGRYSIRSARIAAMLGSLREVGDRVQELAGQPYKFIEDTGSSRRLITGAPSPLTFRQEGVLFETRGVPAVTVALSSPALGLNSVAKAIEDLARDDDRLLALTSNVASVGELERAITSAAEMIRKRQRQRALLVAEGPWLGKEAIEAVFAHAEVRRAQRAATVGVRVVLLPRMVDWLELPDRVDRNDRLWKASTLTLSTMQAGGLVEWLERRTAVPPAPGLGERLREATGGFPSLLEALTGKTNEDLVEAAETSAAAMVQNADATLLELGLGDQRLRTIARFVQDQSGGRIDADDRDALIGLMEEAGLRSPDQGLDVLEQLGILDRSIAVDAPVGLLLNALVDRLLAARSTP